jgi:hypothetical protein
MHTSACQSADPVEAATPADGAPAFPTGSDKVDGYAATGRITVLAGIDEALTVFQSGLLLASKLRAKLDLKILEAASVEIQFGAASCRSLLLGLMESVEQQLRAAAALSGGEFVVRIGALPAGRSISIDVISMRAGKEEKLEPAR